MALSGRVPRSTLGRLGGGEGEEAGGADCRPVGVGSALEVTVAKPTLARLSRIAGGGGRRVVPSALDGGAWEEKVLAAVEKGAVHWEHFDPPHRTTLGKEKWRGSELERREDEVIQGIARVVERISL